MKASIVTLCARAIVLVVMSLPATARSADAEPAWRGFYVGGGGAYSTVSVERNGLNCDEYYYPTIVPCPGYDEGDGDYGWSVHAGYRWHRNFAVEASYLDTGTIRWKKNLVYVPEFDGFYNNRIDLSSRASALSALGILPFAQRWEVYLRLGAGFWDAESDARLDDSFGEQVIAVTDDDTGTGFLIGLGLGVTLARAWHLRFDYQGLFIDGDILFTNNESSLDSLLLEAQYRFGNRRRPAATEGPAAPRH